LKPQSPLNPEDFDAWGISKLPGDIPANKLAEPRHETLKNARNMEIDNLAGNREALEQVLVAQGKIAPMSGT
jgi:hypothetical protein